jgi:PAS domain-containing protein
MNDLSILNDKINRLERRLEREKNARKEAERLLESKSLELYKIHEKLHDETRLLEATVINAKDGVIITTADLDNDGPKIIYVNAAFTKLSGYEPEEIIGQTPRILQGPDTCKKTLAML